MDKGASDTKSNKAGYDYRRNVKRNLDEVENLNFDAQTERYGNTKQLLAEPTENVTTETRQQNPLTSHEIEQNVEDLSSEDSKMEEEEKIELHYKTKTKKSSNSSNEGSLKSKLQQAIKKKWEKDKQLTQPVSKNDFDQQRIDFWTKKKSGFESLKVWQNKRKTILNLHKTILLVIFKQIIEKIKNSANESQRLIKYLLMIAEQESIYSELIKKNWSFLNEIKHQYEESGKEYHLLWEGIENYESTLAKEKNDASSIIKETINNTIGASFKELTSEADKFGSLILKKVKRLHMAEKESEKSFQVFTTMLQEAEQWVNQGKLYDKDFWFVENQFLIDAKKQYDKQRELAKYIIDIWNKAEVLEENKIKSIKNMYNVYFTKTKNLTPNSKNLVKVIANANEETAAYNIYKFKNILNDQEYTNWITLDECLGTHLDFDGANTAEFKQFILAMFIQSPPQTTNVLKEGNLERDPGFMKSWKSTSCVVTTEGFLHCFDSKAEKEPTLTLNWRKVKVSIKKDTYFDVVEEKKGMFSSNAKISMKADSLVEMEDWIKTINLFT